MEHRTKYNANDQSIRNFIFVMLISTILEAYQHIFLQSAICTFYFCCYQHKKANAEITPMLIGPTVTMVR